MLRHYFYSVNFWSGGKLDAHVKNAKINYPLMIYFQQYLLVAVLFFFFLLFFLSWRPSIKTHIFLWKSVLSDNFSFIFIDLNPLALISFNICYCLLILRLFHCKNKMPLTICACVQATQKHFNFSSFFLPLS